ncbi:hypothetical protein G6F50_015326 [Rhizopus delemar]|uniref:Uncharacterized protein n=1 Tax=Rhizopus delemar TaxID=936053 RepID=A0A9P6XYG9_9FUNG|nr:hypothetical protein G6F50_015326 [Rhizopus delemar]
MLEELGLDRVGQHALGHEVVPVVAQHAHILGGQGIVEQLDHHLAVGAVAVGDRTILDVAPGTVTQGLAVADAGKLRGGLGGFGWLAGHGWPFPLAVGSQVGRCSSTYSAEETSNWPGCSIQAARTTPSTTYRAKRRERMPMPEALASSSRPSTRVSSALPSDSISRPSGTFCSAAQAFITNGSLTAMQ